MKQHTLKIYDAVVDIYEFTHDEFLNANIQIEGETTPISILENGEYTPASRELQSYYARGFASDRDIYVLADNINTKQLANLFLSLGAKSAIAAAHDITKVKISEGFIKEEEIIKTINEAEEGDTHVAPIDLSDAVTVEDVKPKAKKKRNKK
jgi:hypothetical protein